MAGPQVLRPGTENPAAPAAGNAGPPTLRAEGQKPETGNGVPGTGNGFPAGPLAQAVRGGANVGVAERPPLPQAAKAEPIVEGPKGVISGSASDVVRAQLKVLLSSPNLGARMKALKLAQQVATPDMSGSIAEAALIDSGLKDNVLQFVRETETYKQREEVLLQSKRTSNPNSNPRLSDEERNQIMGEVLGSMAEPLKRQTATLLYELYAKDPAATVDGLFSVYHRQKKIIGPSSWGIQELDAIKASCELIDAALLSGTKKEPCLLRFADRLIEDGAFEDAANLIGKIGLPEGVERLGTLAQKAGDQLARTTRLGAAFLSACAAVGTPECLPLLDAVQANPELHAQMAETAAKILNIDLA